MEITMTYTQEQIAEAQAALDEISESVNNHRVVSPSEQIVLKLATIGLSTMKAEAQA